ncbi:carboxylase [Lentimicrobium sp.]|uniref:carboxylase n=1 Tax=Lentimicrobium sp. TaxID=2034841 RepID=UPI002CEEF8BA|nr:carboxylase [Lentimicrobium sp.]MCO5263334.1 carboxylase [Lentimicrobium sp.]HPR26160.1 carboxylase [Lentimicrobium sp.]
MTKKLLIRDLTLRDGQQSLFATRMTQQQVDRVLPLYREAGFYAMEVWGGAVPDSVMRYLNENPWSRLEKIKEGVGDTTKLTALSRGRNLFGYNPYPDDVIDGFNRNAIRSGISIMRIFDALNDTDNIGSTIRSVKENGGIADCAICYTVDPYFSRLKRLKALLQAKPLQTHIFTDEYYIEKALKLQGMGADMISIKDMAGLIPPLRAGRLVRLLKKNLDIPVDFHTHCTPGYGLASTLMAIVNGADIVDTNIMSFSGGTAAASFEIIQLFCDRMNIETGVNREAVVQIDALLREIRHELAEYDQYKEFPKEFNIVTDKLPRDIDELFELAIAYAKADKEDDLLSACGRIESYFNFPEPDEKVKEAEVPGGMYSNMLAQLKQLKLEKLLPRTLEIIPSVRMDAGCPPLVTPTSQIVGVQAVNCAIDESKGQPMYTTKSIQFVNLVKGIYGKTPVPVDPEFRYSIAGVREETPYDTRFYKRQENPVFHEYGGVKLAADEKEELLLELFPAVASDFLKRRVEQAYLDEIHRVEAEKRAAFEAEKQAYERLSPEEKQQRLLEGLYNYDWTTEGADTLGHS